MHTRTGYRRRHSLKLLIKVVPYLSIWTVGMDYRKSFFLICLGRPPILKNIEHRLEERWRILEGTRIDETTLRVQSDHKPSDDSKVAPGTPDTKKQIRILVLAGGNHRTVGNNDRCLKTSSLHFNVAVNVGGLLQQDYQ